MSTTELTRKEIWVITTLLKLPIQQGSLLGEWLGIGETPSVEMIESWIPEVTEGLINKNISTDSKILSGELLESLILATVGQKQLSITLRTSEVAFVTHFLIAGSGVVQYGMEEDRIILHPSRQFGELLSTLLPEWLKIESSVKLGITLSQKQFLLFKQACLLKDFAFLLKKDGSETFALIDLEKSILHDNDWLGFYHTLGIIGTDPIDQISITNELKHLLSINYIEKVDSTLLKIGTEGNALAKILSDPDQVMITIGFTNLNPQQMIASTFLIGAGCLLRMDFNKDLICIIGMDSRMDGLVWIKNLINAV
jgi:hypothetical protein